LFWFSLKRRIGLSALVTGLKTDQLISISAHFLTLMLAAREHTAIGAGRTDGVLKSLRRNPGLQQSILAKTIDARQ
jgi:hypothetical protein